MKSMKIQYKQLKRKNEKGAALTAAPLIFCFNQFLYFLQLIWL